MAAELVQIVEATPHAPGFTIIVSCDYSTLPNRASLDGAERDGLLMEETMKNLGYAVKRVHNITQAELVALLYHAAEGVTYPPSFRRLMFVFSGHGKDGSLITSEGKETDVSEIVKKLSPNSESSPLRNMVRLFVIDACRGNIYDKGLVVPKGGSARDTVRIPHCQGNLLLAYSTVPGFRSFEEVGHGGMWLSLVAEELKSDGDIQCIFTAVSIKLMKKLQDPKYNYVQQPETIVRLNECVNLRREAPGL